MICAPITKDVATRFDLPQMVTANADPNQTAYTISIDAVRQHKSTGISAEDRSLTCRLLACDEATASSFRRPGHVFPLVARSGGIRERQGHTEAAIEFCRLAKKSPAGIISELVDDGEPEQVEGQLCASHIGSGMLRRDGCLAFGKKYRLRVCTIDDLVQYVCKHSPHAR